MLLIENESEKTGLEETLRGHQVHLPVPAESDTDLICVGLLPPPALAA